MKQFLISTFLLIYTYNLSAQETKLLREPDLGENHLVFCYAADIWAMNLEDKSTSRITSTSAIESNPHLSPDGKTIAFTSNRSGGSSVYSVSVEGGTPKRLTWYPSASYVRGWTTD